MSGTVWVIPAAGGPPTRLSDDQGERIGCPRWSPAGGQDRVRPPPLTESDLPKIRIARATGEGKPVVASKTLDMSPAEIDWVEDGALYFTAPTRGETHIFAVDPGDWQVRADQLRTARGSADGRPQDQRHDALYSQRLQASG